MIKELYLVAYQLENEEWQGIGIYNIFVIAQDAADRFRASIFCWMEA